MYYTLIIVTQPFLVYYNNIFLLVQRCQYRYILLQGIN